jgi:hypothetical protein
MGLQSDDPHVAGQLAARWSVGGVAAGGNHGQEECWCCGCVVVLG